MADIRGWLEAGAKWVEVRAGRFGALFVKTAPAGYQYVSQQNLTSTDTTANALTVPPGVSHAYIHVTGADIYYDFDPGVTPSASHGDTAAIDDDIPVHGPEKLAGFRAVRQGGTNFTLKVLYFSDARDE